jgi:hypothetical protein
MKLSFHMPIHARTELHEPRLFVQNGLRTFLLDRWPDKELWIADDPQSTLDIDAEISKARKACGVSAATIHYFRASVPGVAFKRNEMARQADAAVFVQHDEDDLYLPTYGTHIADWLGARPKAIGQCGQGMRRVYRIWSRSYGLRRGGGSALHCLRANAWQRYHLAYPPRHRGSDIGLEQALQRRLRGQLVVARPPVIAKLWRHMIVIRLGKGHLSPGRPGVSLAHSDPGGTWLLSKVPKPLRAHYEKLLKTGDRHALVA